MILSVSSAAPREPGLRLLKASLAEARSNAEKGGERRSKAEKGGIRGNAKSVMPESGFTFYCDELANPWPDYKPNYVIEQLHIACYG